MSPLLRSLLTVVGIPTLASIIYFGLVATDIYVSDASFAIRSATSSSQSSGLSSLLTSSIVSGGTQDSLLVAEYVQSRDMLAQLQERIDVAGHYSNKTIDLFSRLASDATAEETLEYFEKHVRVLRDTQSDVLTLSVRAFDPATSQAIAANIIEISEALINEISDRMEADAVSSARAEVDLAMQKVEMSSAALSQFRSVNVSMNPVMEAEALFGVVSGLEQSITSVETELVEKRAYMRESAPEVVALNNRLNAMKEQRSVEKSRLLGVEGAESGNLIGDYEPLEVTHQLAQQQYASALTSLELARIEAQRKKMYLVTFIQPALPDEAVEPRRFMGVLTVMVFSFVVYLIGGLMWSALKDHMGK